MDTICIDLDFSTTRCLTTEKPRGLRRLEPNISRQGEGGLRRKGYYKRSYPGKPLVSVIMVVHNDEHYVERAIQSVLNQTYDNVEYIIIDGSSTDGTLDLIRKYQEYIDYWISEPDKGIYDAMNKAVETASGEWIYFLGADDILVNCLHKIIGFLKSQRRIYYGNVYLPAKNKTYEGRFDLYKFMRKNINHQAIFYPKRVFDKYRYSLKYPGIGDYEFNIRCWADREFKFVYIPFLFAVFNDTRLTIEEDEYVHDKVLSKFYNDRPKLFKKYFSKALLFQRAYLAVIRVLRRLLKRLGLKEYLSRFKDGF